MLEGCTLPIYGDGFQLRNWIHVHDHCRAIDAILNGSAPGEVWNIGSSSSESNLTLVGKLCDHVDQEFAADADLARRFPHSAPAQGKKSRQLIRHVRDRPGHDRRYAIDCSKLREQLGFVAATDLTRGLAATVSWYLTNEPWWRPLRNEGATGRRD
jgi:dTDP-glucose 4,6-dehydratase